MDYEQLKIFITVVDCGSFSKAGQLMNTSHSTTSRGVSALEEELGLCLLERSSRKMELTAAGETLYREGKRILDATDSLEAKLRAMAEQVGGRVRIVCANIKSEALSELCRGFCAEYPAVIFDLKTAALSKAFSDVKAGNADVGVSLSYALPEDMSGFDLRRIDASQFCAVVSKQSPLAGQGSVSSESLRRYAYIGAGRATSRFTASVEALVVNARLPEDIITAPSLDALFMQVRSGNGVSLVPEPMARKLAEGCDILQLEGVDSRFDVVAFWRKDSENPLAELFGRFCPKGEKQ